MTNSSNGLARWWRWTIYFAAVATTSIGLVLLLMVLAGVFRPKVVEHGVSNVDSRRPVVDTSTLASEEVRLLRRARQEAAVGSVRPVHEASLASKLLARVVEVNVKAGQAVNQGDVLIRLDDADLQARLKQAESAASAAESRHVQTRNDFVRAEQAVRSKAISRADFDAAQAAQAAAAAEVQRIGQAVVEAKALLEYATIRSPLTGVVVDKLVEPGDTAAPGQTLLTLYEPNRMQLVATVRESLAQRLHVGDQVAARLDTLGHDCQATVSEIVPQAETTSRSFTVKVTGPCPPGIYSGMFGRIFVPLADEQVLVVPRQAVVRVGQLDLVDVVADGQLHRRSVQIGRQLPEGYEVLSGLRAGERVIVRPAGTGREEPR